MKKKRFLSIILIFGCLFLLFSCKEEEDVPLYNVAGFWVNYSDYIDSNWSENTYRGYYNYGYVDGVKNASENQIREKCRQWEITDSNIINYILTCPIGYYRTYKYIDTSGNYTIIIGERIN